MGWVRIDDSFAQHPKVAGAGPLAMALQIAGICYCNQNLTDGFIPWAVAHRLLSWEFLGPQEEKGRKRFQIAVTSGMCGDDVTSEFVIRLLLEAGMWHEVDGGYVIHDYLDYQPSREQVLAEREQKQEAGRKGGLASARARAQAGGQAPAKASAQARAQAKANQVLKQNSSTSSSKTQAEFNPNPNPDPNTHPKIDPPNHRSQDGPDPIHPTSGVSRSRAKARPNGQQVSEEVKAITDFLRNELEANGIYMAPDWHLKSYQPAKRLLKKASLEELQECIRWCIGDPYWSKHLDSMAAVERAFPKWQLRGREPPAPPYHQPFQFEEDKT